MINTSIAQWNNTSIPLFYLTVHKKHTQLHLLTHIWWPHFCYPLSSMITMPIIPPFPLTTTLWSSPFCTEKHFSSPQCTFPFDINDKWFWFKKKSGYQVIAQIACRPSCIVKEQAHHKLYNRPFVKFIVKIS